MMKAVALDPVLRPLPHEGEADLSGVQDGAADGHGTGEYRFGSVLAVAEGIESEAELLPEAFPDTFEGPARHEPPQPPLQDAPRRERTDAQTPLDPDMLELATRLPLAEERGRPSETREPSAPDLQPPHGEPLFEEITPPAAAEPELEGAEFSATPKEDGAETRTARNGAAASVRNGSTPAPFAPEPATPTGREASTPTEPAAAPAPAQTDAPAPRDGDAQRDFRQPTARNAQSPAPQAARAPDASATEPRSRTPEPSAPRLEAAGGPATPLSAAERSAAAEGARLRALPELPVQNEVEIVQRIRLLAQAGGGRVRIDLQPPQLGGLEIRLTLVNDAIRLSVVADRGVVGDLIARHLPELRSALEAQGLHIERAEVSARDPEDRAGSRDADTATRGDRDGRRSGPRLPEGPAHPGLPLPSREILVQSLGAVDLHV